MPHESGDIADGASPEQLFQDRGSQRSRLEGLNDNLEPATARLARQSSRHVTGEVVFYNIIQDFQQK
jgi:hypothetical protein